MKFGYTDCDTSKICFGTLTTSPLQKNFNSTEAANLFLYGYQKGIRFFDTAELYQNYESLRIFLNHVERKKVTLSTKSYAYDEETAKKSLDKALRELNTDYIDIFMLHEQESIHTIRGHYDAIVYFMNAKKEGVIKHLGLSTHYIAGVRAAIETPEIEIIHPIVNMKGIGLQDGGNEILFPLLKKAKEKHKTIFAMKPLGGGHLCANNQQALSFVNGLDFVDAIALGMQKKEEIDANVAFFSEADVDSLLPLSTMQRSIHVADWCIGCGACVSKCGQKAIILEKGRAQINLKRCIYCGYCAGVCPEFCIKVF